MMDEDYELEEESPHWKCQECGHTPFWQIPPANFFTKGHKARKCPRCKSEACTPVGL